MTDPKVRAIAEGARALQKTVGIQEAINLSNKVYAANPDAPVIIKQYSDDIRNSIAKRIQDKIDTYSISGANLLEWLTEPDFRTSPKVKTYLFGLIRIKPSRQEWLDWGSDVACNATFKALYDTLKEVKEDET